MVAPKAKERKTELEVVEIKHENMEFFVRGDSPLVPHRLSLSARRELLLPRKKKNDAEKQSTAKHDPIHEYRESFYMARDPKSPTAIVMPGAAFKGGIMTAAMRMPGDTSKTEIGQLATVMGLEVAIYGTPQIFMTEVRNSGMNRTPDIRTRPILPEWAAKFTVRITLPMLTTKVIGSLVAAAGMIAGVGDGRPEKGKLSFGQYRIIGEAEFKKLAGSLGARKEQEAAIDSPEAFDPETADLLEWFEEETKKRSLAVTQKTEKLGRKPKKTDPVIA